VRKTTQMLALEARHGKPIDQLIAESLAEHGSIRRAAASLSVNPYTFNGWISRLHIQVRKAWITETALPQAS
jgi:hypothetical protein